MWIINCVLLRNFDRKILNALRRCEICATPDDRRPEFLAKHSITFLAHNTHLTLLFVTSSCSQNYKNPQGRRFETIPEIKANATKELKVVTKEALQDCFIKWKHRWDKCVRWEGEYFEGDLDV